MYTSHKSTQPLPVGTVGQFKVQQLFFGLNANKLTKYNTRIGYLRLNCQQGKVTFECTEIKIKRTLII